MLTVKQYEAALKAISPGRKEILIRYYKNGPFEDANIIAAVLNYKGFGAVNLHVGAIGKYFSDFSGVESDREYEYKNKIRPAYFHFMHDHYKDGWDLVPRLRKAIENLKWPGAIEDEEFEIIPGEEQYVTRQMITEGRMVRVLVNRYERDRTIIAKATKIHGRTCAGCKMDFKSVYGSDIPEIIHFHHIRPLAVLKNETTKDVVKDIVPLCPNCHAVVHSTNELISIKSLVKRINSSK